MINFHKQRGFSLVTAIFLLVVLAALGAYMVTIGGTNRASSTAALQGARAFQAARSGIDWSIYTITTAADQATARTNCDNIIDANTFTLNVAGLGGFTVNTNCGWTGHDQQGNDNVTVYTLTSTATSGVAYGNLDFVQRRITATISPP